MLTNSCIHNTLLTQFRSVCLKTRARLAEPFKELLHVKLKDFVRWACCASLSLSLLCIVVVVVVVVVAVWGPNRANGQTSSKFSTLSRE